MTDAQNHVRPTEAQLRWAGFHFKRRAGQVKEAVDQFYLQPFNVKDVDGAFSEDGNTTEESVASETNHNSSSTTSLSRRSKPKISRGRRAMLRVSKRRYEKRRAAIEERGYGAGGASSSTEDEEAALEAIFAQETVQKRRRRRRKGTKSAKEADRVRRFEAAFHSMMKNMEAFQQPQLHVIETPTKIWTRPEGAENMEALDYSAMKLLGSQRKGIHNPTPNRLSALPVDRGASWLVHVPGKSRRNERHPTHGANYQKSHQQSGRNLFKDIVTDFQHLVQSPLPPSQQGEGNAPTMKISKYFVPAKLDGEDSDEERGPTGEVSGDFVRMRAAALQNQSQQQQVTEDQLNSVIHSIDPELLKEMEELDPGVTNRLRALYLGDASPQINVKTIAKYLESPRENAEKVGFVQQFVASMEHAIQTKQEGLVAADGKLQKAAFAQLVNSYLFEISTSSTPKARNNNPVTPNTKQIAANSNTTFTPRTNRNGKISDLAETIMAKINGEQDAEAYLNSAGTFDKEAFGNLVTKYLSEVTGFDEETVRNAEDLESLAHPKSNADEHDANHIHSISTQLALDFLAAVEPFMVAGDTSTKNDPDHVSSNVESLAKKFLVDNCGVQPEEYHHEPKDEALFRMVSDLHLSGLSAIQNVQNGTFRENDFLVSTSTNFIKFFEASMTPAEDCKEAENEKSTPDFPEIRSSLVRDLIAHIQDASIVEGIVSENGSLDTQKVAHLMRRYLASASKQSDGANFFSQAQSPLALAQVRRAAGSNRNRDSHASNESGEQSFQPISEAETSKFIDCCIQQLESTSRGELFLGVDGGLDEIKLGQVLETSFDPDFFPSNVENPVHSLVLSQSFNRDHDDRMASRSVVSELTYESMAAREIPGLGNIGLNHTETNVVGNSKVADSVSRRFGGFVRRLYNPNNGAEDENKSDESGEMRAYSAFRRSARDGHGDDISSHSSFFPGRIKSVVKQFGLLSPKGNKASADNETGLNPGSPASRMASELSSENKGNLLNLIQARGEEIIDTDGQSLEDPHNSTLHAERMKNLMLSPAILSKRHRQAIRCIENRQWKEVQYLISANPWLAEMSDANTKQFLLHKLALYGAGESFLAENGTYERHAAAPDDINKSMVKMFPASIQRFDSEGNLPLHMAAASANVSMTTLLGDRFPSGCTVRNEDGLLPLHLSLLACASPLTSGYGNAKAVSDMVSTIIGYFPGAVAVPDDQGNLPIHTAASVLRGDVGVDAIYMLIDEAERQLQNPRGVRFRNKLKLEDIENMSVETEGTETPTDSSNNLDDVLHCTMVKNDLGETPLLCAIHSCARREVIDALLQGPCGHKTAMTPDENENNALHLLMDERYMDPTSALSVLKVAPETVRSPNNEGVLPIELACMNSLPLEVIMAIVLVDLPIDIDNKEKIERRDGFGGSWWYIACDCDDHYTAIVDEIVALCSVAQVRELAYMENVGGDSLISRAAPESREILQCSLRFLGRFDINSEVALPKHSVPRGVTLFEAVDYSYADDTLADGIDVYLKFFPTQSLYDSETELLRQLDFDYSLVEEVFAFDCKELGDEVNDVSKQYCLCIEQPQLTLSGVVAGMMSNEDCQKDQVTRKRYALKALAVLRAVAKGISHLHSIGVIHGNLAADFVGKYDNQWKLAGVSNVQKIGRSFDASRSGAAIPPEAISPMKSAASSRHHEVVPRKNTIASGSIDSWGFGKLAYEVLVGISMIRFENVDISQNQEALMDILHWNDFNLDDVRRRLGQVGVPDSAVELIGACLSPDPSHRPSSAEIVDHHLWQELRRHKRNSPS